MRWKLIRRIFWIVLLLIVLIPAVLYWIAIDQDKTYTKAVSELPLYSGQSEDGIYRLSTGQYEFKIRIAGYDNTGDDIILLHGFPQTSATWSPLIKAAADQGYRVLAFDQRGYSPGARPAGKENYHIDSLVQDVIGVADAVGLDTFHLVGHDWGAGVGWKTVIDHPQRIKTWTALSIPHVAVFFDSFLHHPEQKKRSSYIGFLRLPILPELLFQVRQKTIFTSIESVWTEEQIKEATAMFREHGALTATMNWYRALDYKDEQTIASLQKQVTRPTLFIWGQHDMAVAPDIVPLQKPWISSTYEELALDAGHSLMQEKTTIVIETILRHWAKEKTQEGRDEEVTTTDHLE